MDRKIRIGVSKTIISLKPSDYRAAGGEAEIYTRAGQAYKMYHDPDTKMLPISKMAELDKIKNPQVILPREIIYDANTGKPLGYTTTFLDNVEPLVKLFTRTFKVDNNIDFQAVTELVKQMQSVVIDVHKAKCLIVDLNELNILVKVDPLPLVPWFIDTDSYSTPSFKATAIMDSVRDRRVSTYDKTGALHYNPDELSDWFSWSVLAFNLYTNIHAFRGSHPNYKPRDKQKQMDDGISVFHPGVRTPPNVNDFKVIPPRHLDWFKRVFFNGERGIPPAADSNVPLLVPTQIVTLKGTDKLDVIEISAYPDAVTSVYQFMGIYYVVTKSGIYANKKNIGNYKAKKALLACANDGAPILATQDGLTVSFSEIGRPAFGTIQSKDMFSRNGLIYTVTNGKMIENSFKSFGTKMIHTINAIENVSVTTSQIYDGCVIQDLLGKQYLTIPYKTGSSFSKHVPQLDGYRIVAAKSDKTVTVVLGEKAGKYNRFVIIFDRKYTDVQVRETKDVAYDEINFAVMDNGLCAHLASPSELELFVTAASCDVLTNPPLDSSMKLFTTSDGIFFVNGNSIHQLKKK